VEVEASGQVLVRFVFYHAETAALGVTDESVLSKICHSLPKVTEVDSLSHQLINMINYAISILVNTTVGQYYPSQNS